jgi:hypothetical protein
MKWLKDMWRKLVLGLRHRKKLRELKKKLEEGDDPFTY